MSAKRDWDFPVHFYFGNAAHDLSHLMSIEDDKEITLEARLDNLDMLLSDIEKVQEHISYYLRDILRVTN